MDISVVIPLYNEAESLPELFSWIERVMKEHNYTYEVIFVNDGSTDNSWEVIEELKQRSPHVRGIKFRRNYGKSPGLHCGFAQPRPPERAAVRPDDAARPRRLRHLHGRRSAGQPG